jgi:hypothetical protein
MKKLISMLKDRRALKRSGNYLAYKMMSRDPTALRALRDLNESAEKLEKMGKEKFGPSYKRQRYSLIDFFIS